MSKVWLRKGEVLELTGWTEWLLEQLVESKVLKAWQYKEGANRKFKREHVERVLKKME